MQQTTPPLTVATVLATVKRIATDRPNVTYRTFGDGRRCFYNHGQCSDMSVGCIFGQAFRELGIDVVGCEGDNIADVVSQKQIAGSADDLQMCSDIQNAQDMGHSWGEALKTAEENREAKLEEQNG